MVKLHLSLAAAFAACTLINAQKARGSIFRLKTRSKDYVDQVRILTKPKNGYDAENDHPTVYMIDNGCEDVTIVDFIIGPVDDESKCCEMESLDGFNLWAEKQDYTIPYGINIKAQETFNPGVSCSERTSVTDVQDYELLPGEQYNSYMAQVWSNNNTELYTENVIEFHNQDIVAMIWTDSELDNSDEYFGLGEERTTYQSVRGYGRGLEVVPGSDSFSLNCEIPENCPSDAGSMGDPHFKTWKREHFEFHGQCDLVLTSDPKFADGLGMDVHIRTKLVRYWSYIKNAVIRIGDDVFEVQGSTDADDQTEAIYWYNLEYQGRMTHVGGFPITVKISKSKSHKRTFEIDLSSKYPGQKIIISTFNEFVRVDFVNASAQAFGKSAGMLGDFKTGNTLARDGETVLNDFHEFGSEWQVLPSEHIFFHSVSDPQFPMRCILPEDPRGDRRRRLGEETVSAEEAEAACAKTLSDPLDVKDCVYDILATQNLDMVGAF